jgi:hypothetical protein
VAGIPGRDLGVAVGAVTAGILADAAGIRVAIVAVAAITGASRRDVAARMRETNDRSSLSRAVPMT